MTLYLDTSSPNGPGPLTATGMVYDFGGVETAFFISCASNIILGQTSGPSIEFVLDSKTEGRKTFQVDYGTAMPPTKMVGYLLSATVPAGNSVSARVVVADYPSDLRVQTTASAVTGTTSTAVTINASGILTSALPILIQPPVGYKWEITLAKIVLSTDATAGTRDAKVMVGGANNLGYILADTGNIAVINISVPAFGTFVPNVFATSPPYTTPTMVQWNGVPVLTNDGSSTGGIWIVMKNAAVGADTVAYSIHAVQTLL